LSIEGKLKVSEFGTAFIFGIFHETTQKLEKIGGRKH
jgi:hypothetical protein